MKETFGQRLARLRKEHNLTQNDIGEKLNISYQAVSKWENDLTAPDIDTLVKLSDIFHISIDELLGKESDVTQYVVLENKKDLDRLVFKIFISDAEGTTMKINLPIAIIRMIANEINKPNIISGNKALEGIDFKHLINLVEEGILGELLSIDSADGDHVLIKVE